MGEWRLVIPTTFAEVEGKNYLELLLQEAHEATAHGGIEKTMKYLTDRYMHQEFSRLVKEYVTSCDTCQRTKYPYTSPLGLVTPLHVPTAP